MVSTVTHVEIFIFGMINDGPNRSILASSLEEPKDPEYFDVCVHAYHEDGSIDVLDEAEDLEYDAARIVADAFQEKYPTAEITEE